MLNRSSAAAARRPEIRGLSPRATGCAADPRRPPHGEPLLPAAHGVHRADQLGPEPARAEHERGGPRVRLRRPRQGQDAGRVARGRALLGGRTGGACVRCGGRPCDPQNGAARPRGPHWSARLCGLSNGDQLFTALVRSSSCWRVFRRHSSRFLFFRWRHVRLSGKISEVRPAWSGGLSRNFNRAGHLWLDWAHLWVACTISVGQHVDVFPRRSYPKRHGGATETNFDPTLPCVGIKREDVE